MKRLFLLPIFMMLCGIRIILCIGMLLKEEGRKAEIRDQNAKVKYLKETKAKLRNYAATFSESFWGDRTTWTKRETPLNDSALEVEFKAFKLIKEL